MPKRTKNIKVTDVRGQKPWLKKVGRSKYPINSRDTNKLFLIVCEGQSEKLYFESFPVLTLTVEAIDLQGQSKLKMIELTEQIIGSTEKKYDEIWCVFDMDVKKGEVEFSDFDNAIHKGVNNGYNIAYSNDAYEFWYYLHYDFTDQQNHRKFYYDALSNRWNINYEKEGKKYSFCTNVYSLLNEDVNASQVEAIERADVLYNQLSHLPYHQQNPATLVYQLVRVLNMNLRG